MSQYMHKAVRTVPGMQYILFAMIRIIRRVILV